MICEDCRRSTSGTCTFHQVSAAQGREIRTPVEPPARTLLVTLHFPLDARCVAEVLRAIDRAYPDARLGEDGTVWDRPEGAP